MIKRALSEDDNSQITVSKSGFSFIIKHQLNKLNGLGSKSFDTPSKEKTSQNIRKFTKRNSYFFLPETLRNLRFFTSSFSLQQNLLLKHGSLIVKFFIMMIMELINNSVEENSDFWNIILNHYEDDTVAYINTLDSLTNKNKKKIILWIFLIFHERKFPSILAHMISNSKIINKNDSFFKLYPEEINDNLSKIAAVKYSIDSSIIKHYEFYLLDLKSPSSKIFKPFPLILKKSSIISNFSDSPINIKTDLSNIESKPLLKLKITSEVFDFDEKIEKSLTKSCTQFPEPVYDGNFLTSFIANHEHKTNLSSFFQKNKLFLLNNVEKKKIDDNNQEILEKIRNVIKDCENVKLDLKARLEEVLYLKSHSYPNDYSIDELNIRELMDDFGYIMKILEEYYTEVAQNITELKDEDYESPCSPAEIKILTNASPSPTPKIRKVFDFIIKKRVKNSRKLYLQKYNSLDFNWKFKEKPDFISVKFFLLIFNIIKMSEQNYLCYGCRRPITMGFYILGKNASFCNYVGRWYCDENCISFVKRPIPYKAIEEFDLTSYSISLESQYEIDSLYEKPIINIFNEDPLVKNQKSLYDFLVLKKKIHIIYDIICDVDLINNLMNDKIHLVLKENLFSLKNLVEVFNGSLLRYLEKCIQIYIKHKDICNICEKRGKICEICLLTPKIYPYDIQNTIKCSECKRIYHTKCYNTKKCVFCVQF